ncbi:tRNA 2-selenouridine(34) synthase MnmH [Tepidiphilus margaritifer]|uniref:tRNA 2-selenouridine(34) synthase MnmH n=1 Tax=Tepidiphilus margaritifer TaxID=203471 RepID=UPI0004104D17|nr:tRNA 2-selenouridine(34) synthase MnmH [Tepidiphilus margaritifer]
MAAKDKDRIVPLERIGEFDTIIDARSPSEFLEDHLPGAINLPVLDDTERRIVGTIYKQRSAFEARRLGAAWVAKNLARHLQERLQQYPPSWRPLVYCWRGGQRSAAFVTWLRLIGWPAAQLAGGYKTYRRWVLERLVDLPGHFAWRVLAGPTGSGKTRVLQALAQRGQQVLDLEALARHRGSILGSWPGGESQPSQKAFDTALVAALRRFDPHKPVFVEAESKRIGLVQLPEALHEAMRLAPMIVLDTPQECRMQLLLEDYAWLGDEPEALARRLERFKGFVPNETLRRWHELALRRDLATLFAELIARHYDPLYRRSLARHPELAQAPRVRLTGLDPAALEAACRQIEAWGSASELLPRPFAAVASSRSSQTAP